MTKHIYTTTRHTTVERRPGASSRPAATAAVPAAVKPPKASWEIVDYDPPKGDHPVIFDALLPLSLALAIGAMIDAYNAAHAPAR